MNYKILLLLLLLLSGCNTSYKNDFDIPTKEEFKELERREEQSHIDYQKKAKESDNKYEGKLDEDFHKPFLDSKERNNTYKQNKSRGNTMADFTVSGAGDASYNGTYTESGTFNIKPAYTNGSRWMYWDTMFVTGWALNMSKGGAAVPYIGANSGSTPTTGAWSIGPGMGTAPAPTVAAAGAGETTAPVYASSSVASNGNSVAVVLTEAGSAPILPSTGITGFTVLVNGVSRTISSATASGTTVTLNVTPTIYTGDTVTVSYSPGNVTDSSANAMTLFSAQSVTNGSTVPVPKTRRKSIILNTNGLGNIKNTEVLEFDNEYIGIFKSPNGSKWAVTVDNSGTIIVTSTT